MKRVVITGMGAVTPIGHSVEETWQGIKDGACGIAEITHFDTTNEKCHMGAEVKDWVYPDKRAATRTGPGPSRPHLQRIQPFGRR